MRRVTWILAIVMCFSTFLAGCGVKDAGSVVSDLDHVISKLDSYEGTGEMVFNTGQQPQQYQVKVSYQKPHYYRIELKNEKQDISQIVLRNDDGVFVLTPHLNKSFRFQSDWPDNQSQVYLYQSLVGSIIQDKDRKFAKENNAFVFDVKANYQDSSLARQKIWLDASSYSPRQVEVEDESGKVLVKMNFTQFDFGKKFDKDFFDMQRNMTSYQIQSLPTMAPSAGGKSGEENNGGTGDSVSPGTRDGKEGKPTEPGKETKDGKDVKDTGAGSTAPGTDSAGKGTSAAAAGQSDQTARAGQSGQAVQSAQTGASAAGRNAGPQPAQSQGQSGPTAQSQPQGQAAKTGQTAQSGATGNSGGKSISFGVIEPSYLPDGVTKQDMKDITLGGDQGVLLRYSGKYSFTLVESAPTEQTVSALPATPLNLGFTIGVLAGKPDDPMKTLMWTYNGVEFRLSTGDLPQDEMIKVAQAVQGQLGK